MKKRNFVRWNLSWSCKSYGCSTFKEWCSKRSTGHTYTSTKKCNISIIRKGNRFYIIDDGKEYEAHLVAEGLQKMATILYLCINGELKPESILFWDEPESNMNPTLISIIVDLIVELAKNIKCRYLYPHMIICCHTSYQWLQNILLRKVLKCDSSAFTKWP